MPDPSESPGAIRKNAVCERIKQYVAQTDGRAFVLFTSYRMLQKLCAKRLTPWFAQHNLALYTQGRGDAADADARKRFRNDPRSVLFGADTFWQGVDIPGDALQNVIITKLPFSVPDQPLLQARVESIREPRGEPVHGVSDSRSRDQAEARLLVLA